MTQDQKSSLQDRIVKEINSTYNSIASYKDFTSKDKSLDTRTVNRRIKVVEHKLKALKMMLAKIDNGENIAFDKRNLAK